MLSDSPPDKNINWSESGIDGCWKYVNKLYKLVANFIKDASPYDENAFFNIKLPEFSDKQLEIIKLTHKTIKLVSENLEKMAFNVVIAKIREFSNAIEKFSVQDNKDQKIKSFALNNLILLFSPIMPHLAEELWQLMGNNKIIANDLAFPKFNPKLIVDDKIKIAIQVNGKLRSVLEIGQDLERTKIEELALNDENVQRNISGKNIKKVIFIPGKLINIVAV
jgi:leucyl-tRNA synthetase